MRMTRYHLFLLGFLTLSIVGSVAYTQFGPPGGGKGSKGGGGSSRMTDFVFMMLSQGGESIDINKVQIPEEMAKRSGQTPEKYKESMAVFLQKKGVTNGVMTKEVFGEYMQEAMREGNKKRSEETFTKLAAGNASFSVDTVEIPREVAGWDSPETVRERMKQFLTQKGVNSGSMTKDLYLEYREARFNEIRAKMEGKSEEKPSASSTQSGNAPAWVPTVTTPVPDKKEEDVRPVVWRYGKLPKELPEWFGKLDRDEDGQVGLYEWKKDGRDLDEFAKLDLNTDGFLTAEEVLRYQKLANGVKTTRTNALMPPIMTASTNSGGSGGEREKGKGKGGFGGFGGFGKSKGPPKGEGSESGGKESDGKRRFSFGKGR